MAKTKTSTKKTNRTVAQFVSESGKIMNVVLTGTRLSASVKDGETRIRGKATKLASAEEAQAAFESTCAKALAGGWSRKTKTVDVEDLIALA